MTKANSRKIAFLIILAMGIMSSGCEKNNDGDPPANPDPGYTRGVFILNEGPFQSGTGTITYFSRSAGSKVDKVYQAANEGAVLGNIVQSMNYSALAYGHAYISVNNANEVVVVDLTTFKKVRSIDNITSPRYIEFVDHVKAYVSCWDNTVKVFNTDGSEYIGQIAVGSGPEKMLKVGNALWVLNQGGFTVDSTVSVINTDTDEVIHTLQVYPKPSGIQLDDNGLVWVLCSGKGWNGFPAADDSEAHLLCIDPGDYSIVKDFAFPNTSEHPEKLLINMEGDMLYYNHIDGIYRFDVHGNELESAPFVKRGVMFYGLGFDQEANYLYASDPLDYVQNGMVYRYNAVNGSLVDSLQAGIIPGEFYFTRLSATEK